MQLSTPRPHKAAITCSTVETNTPFSSPSTVASSVAVTEQAVARSSQSGWPGMPVRTKTTPEWASAGLSVRVTGRPECTPTPAIAVRLRNVVCLPLFMSASRPLLGGERVTPQRVHTTSTHVPTPPFRLYLGKRRREQDVRQFPPATTARTLTAYGERANSRFLT